jgi:hypothetical protein
VVVCAVAGKTSAVVIVAAEVVETNVVAVKVKALVAAAASALAAAVTNSMSGFVTCLPVHEHQVDDFIDFFTNMVQLKLRIMVSF